MKYPKIKPHKNAKEVDLAIIPFAADKPIRSSKDYFRYFPEHDGYDFVKWAMKECGFEVQKAQCFFKREIIKGFGRKKPVMLLEWLRLLFWLIENCDNENCAAFYVSTPMDECSLKRLQILKALGIFQELVRS